MGSRKRITIGGVALSFVLAIVIGISGVIAPGGGAALGASTTLTILDGEVLVSRAGGPFEIAQDGAVLGRGDAIRTAAGARAVLTYFEGSTVAIEPSSELAIDQAHASPDGSTVVVMTQNLGRTWHVVTKLIGGGSKYEVRTPAATASVRGTAFEVGVERASNGEFTTRVATTDGVVAAAATATPADPQPEPVVVPAGFRTSARSTERKPEAPTLAPEPERRVTVTIGNPNALVVDPLGRANGYKDGKLVLQTPGAQVTRIAGTLQITLPDLPDGALSTIVQRPADVSGVRFDVPVITTVREKGRSTLLQDTVLAAETVTGVEVKKSAAGSDTAPEVRRVSDEEKKDLKKAKVAVQPTLGARAAIARPGLGDARGQSSSVGGEAAGASSATRTSDGERAPEATGGPGFAQPLPFPNAPNPGAPQREEAKRQDTDKQTEFDASAAEQLQKAAEQAGTAAHAAQKNAESGQQRANEDRSRADEALQAAEAARQRALQQAAQAGDEAKRREAEAAARKAETDKKTAEDAARKAEQESKQKAEEAARAAAAKKAADDLAKKAQEEAEKLRAQQRGGNNQNTPRPETTPKR